MISFRTLGTVELRGPDGGELGTVLSQPKRLALLAYLSVAEPRGFHRRDKLLGLLWSDLDQERARAALRKSLHHLRRGLGSQAVSGRGAEEVGISEGTIWCDAIEFDEGLRAGKLADALDLYGGPFMDGFHISGEPDFERWLETFRDTAARRARTAAWTLLERAEEEHNTAGALSWAERGLALSPFDERWARRLVELKARLGDRSGAIRSFGRFADRFRDEFEMEPSEELAAFVEQLAESKGPAATKVPMPRADADAEGRPSSPEPLADQGGGGASNGPAQRKIFVSEDLEILRLLGDGSVARVYLARETGLKRLVAVKVLHPSLARISVARERFERAARAAARIRHPNVVAIHRVNTMEDGTPYVVMEFIEGRSLADAQRAEGLPSLDRAGAALRQIASALAASHENRVVHRDLRLANVLREDRTERIVLTDFGVARILATGSEEIADLTQPGQLLGHPSHVSPEQVLGKPVAQESDVYSFGVLGYDLLAGRGPFDATGTAEFLVAHASWPPAQLSQLRSDVHPGLADLLERCLAKKPEHRPRAAEVFRILSELPAPTAAERKDGDSAARSG